MFGGIGIFKDGLMFGMIDGQEVFRLKVDETNQQQYESRGMQPFYAASKKKGMPYWEVPADILENKTELAKWAKASFDIAKKNAK